MTREKLLRYGKEYLHDLETACCKIDELHLNFVRESIKALEREPKTDIALDRYRDLQDYFSDEAVAKTILENQTEFKSWLKRLKWNTKKVDELARKLEALEQEPRKGHWIEHPHEAGANWEYSRYECSECHEWEEDDSDYCPSCGADMRASEV